VADTGCSKPLFTYANIRKFNLVYTMNETSLLTQGMSYPVVPRNT